MHADNLCYEQTRLLWHILACMCEQCADSIRQILSSGFVDVILRYIKLGNKDAPVCAEEPWSRPVRQFIH